MLLLLEEIGSVAAAGGRQWELVCGGDGRHVTMSQIGICIFQTKANQLVQTMDRRSTANADLALDVTDDRQTIASTHPFLRRKSMKWTKEENREE